MQEKESIMAVRCELKIRLSVQLFCIPWQALWCWTVTLVTKFSIPTSQPLKIYIVPRVHMVWLFMTQNSDSQQSHFQFTSNLQNYDKNAYFPFLVFLKIFTDILGKFWLKVTPHNSNKMIKPSVIYISVPHYQVIFFNTCGNCKFPYLVYKKNCLCLYFLIYSFTKFCFPKISRKFHCVW